LTLSDIDIFRRIVASSRRRVVASSRRVTRVVGSNYNVVMDRPLPWTLGRVLDWMTDHFQRKAVDPPRLCAEMLLCFALRLDRIRLYTDMRRPMTTDELSAIRELVRRASEHEPIQYITGRAHFFGLELRVTRDVLIPRPESETLVELSMGHIRLRSLATPRVLEMCVGSGCIAAAIASQLKQAEIVATDVSLPAVDVARSNLIRLGSGDRVQVFQGDLYGALATLADRRPFDLLVANPPYIATGQWCKLDVNVRDFEPRLALDGGHDGLDIHRRLLTGAHAWLRPGAAIFLEIAYDQEDRALWMANQFPAFTGAHVERDLQKNPRVLCLTRV
jgi:release factor glutamine methyltransferase